MANSIGELVKPATDVAKKAVLAGKVKKIKISMKFGKKDK